MSLSLKITFHELKTFVLLQFGIQIQNITVKFKEIWPVYC